MGLTSAIFFVDFCRKMCIFVSRPMKIATFLRKNGYSPIRVVDFPLERDTFRNKIMEIVEDFDDKIYNNNNGKPWKSSRILRLNPNFFIFLSFFIIFHFSNFSIFQFFHFFIFLHFFIFFIFSFFFNFHFSSVFFIFNHF